MKASMKISGFKELDRQLTKISRAAGKRAMRDALKSAAKPVQEAAQAAAPRDTGRLSESINISTKLNKAQSRLHKKANGKQTVEVFVGASSPIAHLQEFGTKNHGAQPFMRPAFETNKDEMLDILKEEVGNNIKKAVGRAARRAAKGKK